MVIILSRNELVKGKEDVPAEELSAYDFRLRVDLINKASHIIFIDEEKIEAHFLKTKGMKLGLQIALQAVINKIKSEEVTQDS